MFGLPRLFRSSENWFVAVLISLVAVWRPSFERLPPLSDSPAVLTESDHVVIAEHRPCAQSSGVDDELLEDEPPPPQPATSTTASARGASASFTLATLLSFRPAIHHPLWTNSQA